MTKIRKFWISREELFDTLAMRRSPIVTVDAGNVGGLTAGSIPFANATGFLTEDNNNFFWDATNLRLGLGLAGAAPTARIDIIALAASNAPGINISAGINGEMSTPDGEIFRWGHWNAGTTTFTERLKFDAAGLFYVSYLTAGSVIFAGAGGEIKQDNAGLFWDDVNDRLGINQAIPLEALTVDGNIRLEGTSYSIIGNFVGAGRQILLLRGLSTIADGAGINLYGDADSTYPGMIRMFTNNIERIQINAVGDVGIGTAPLVDNILHLYDVDGCWLLVDSGTGEDSYVVLGEAGVDRGQLWYNTTDHYVQLRAVAENADVWLFPDGTGRVRFGNHVAIGAETITGYISIKDHAGNARKVAVVS